MADRRTRRQALLLAAAALLSPAPALAQPAAAPQSAAPGAGLPSFATAPVTADMVMDATALCAAQLRTGSFDQEALTGAGWVMVASAEGEPVLRAYRHPDNMILMSTLDGASEGDKCMVMAPVGRGRRSMRCARRWPPGSMSGAAAELDPHPGQRTG